MFSGIVEEAARVTALRADRENLHITLQCGFADELHIDQSVAHNGVCLTVVEINPDKTYTVTAIRETLDRSNLGDLREGDLVNLERSMKINGRLDGHIVQGHVEGSVTVNGVSLTVCDSEADSFRVAIIPYTMEHTNFCRIKPGTKVNLEFDIIGKYIARISGLA